MPWQQHRLIEVNPGAVCQHCGKSASLSSPTYTSDNAPTLQRTMKFPDSDIKLGVLISDYEGLWEERCGDTVTFKIGYLSFSSIDRVILMDRQPGSVLVQRLVDVWKENPYEAVPLEGNLQYLQHVLEYVRDGIIRLPSHISREEFMKELTSYQIKFSPSHILDSE